MKFVHPDGAMLQEIATMIETGKIKGVVDRVLPLQETALAHQLVAAGHVRGKIVISIPE